jgi:hypothetical protein
LFDARKHVVPGQVAILDMSLGSEHELYCGVEVVLVTAVTDHPLTEGVKLISVKYLAPASLPLDPRTGHSNTSVWPDEWAHDKLVPWRQPGRRGRLADWTATGIDMDAVWWSCNLTAQGPRIWKKHQVAFKQQWQRLIDSIKARGARQEVVEPHLVDEVVDTLDNEADAGGDVFASPPPTPVGSVGVAEDEDEDLNWL